jgi:hypothetical protein
LQGVLHRRPRCLPNLFRVKLPNPQSPRNQRRNQSPFRGCLQRPEPTPDLLPNQPPIPQPNLRRNQSPIPQRLQTPERRLNLQ